MLLPLTTSIDKNGILTIGGVSVEELKSRFRTPLYVVDIETIKKQCNDYLKFFDFDGYSSEIIYASKAFCTIPMCQLIAKEGLSIDVAGGGELYIALKSGFKPKKMYFHGNNKSWEEINYGIDSRVGIFVVDNFDELEMINSLAMQKNITQQIFLRITPGIKAHTHKYIQTGAIESKFGFGISDGIALEAAKKANELENISLAGLHAHIGSQIFNIEVYDKLIDTMLCLVRDIRDKFGLEIRHINIGGGLGIKYTGADQPPTIEEFACLVLDSLDRYTARYGVKIDKISLEPGRSIIGSAGVTLYEAGNIKEIPGTKNYMATDGGMSDNIRPVLYQAKYEAFIANNASYLGKIIDGEPAELPGKTGKNTKKYDIVGKHCESGDVIIEDAMLPEVRPRDILCIAATGAYCYSMSSNYNGQPRNAVVAVENGKSWIWVERQAYKDLVAKDRRLYK